MKSLFFFIVFILSITVSCKNSLDKIEPTLKLGKGDYVTVNLEVLDSKGINSLFFYGNGTYGVVTSNQLKKYKFITFSFNGDGEGTYSLSVYSNNDTIESVYYVEGGYSPSLTCNANEIKVLEYL